MTDGNRITGGGVSARIDSGFSLVSSIVGPELAAALQLMGEYDPQPATAFGNRDTAPAEIVEGVRAQFAAMAPGLSEFLAVK